MSDNNRIVEVEHENLILGQKLIELCEGKIKALEEENQKLKLQLYTPPGPINIPLIKQRLRTTSEVIKALELKSIPIMDRK